MDRGVTVELTMVRDPFVVEVAFLMDRSMTVVLTMAWSLCTWSTRRGCSPW